ncbi:MAG: WYL domain-containing protein, partial [Pontibacter sp.]|nr:WYL domain-containing protein [Pontibacter sp.]
ATLLRLHYHAASSGAVTERSVEPVAVYFTAGSWVLIAHCRLRGEFREFRLDRIHGLSPQPQIFTPQEFSFDNYVRDQSKKRKPADSPLS